MHNQLEKTLLLWYAFLKDLSKMPKLSYLHFDLCWLPQVKKPIFPPSSTRQLFRDAKLCPSTACRPFSTEIICHNSKAMTLWNQYHLQNNDNNNSQLSQYPLICSHFSNIGLHTKNWIWPNHCASIAWILL